jgi:hypothetical protein
MQFLKSYLENLSPFSGWAPNMAPRLAISMFRVLREQRRWLAASPGGAFELGTVLERYKPADSYYRGWLSFSSSTLAVVKLRSVRQLSNPHELQVREQVH